MQYPQRISSRNNLFGQDKKILFQRKWAFLASQR